MRRGTTPDYILTVPGYDLRESTVYVTIAQSGKRATLTGARLSVAYEGPEDADRADGDGGATTIRFRLTQAETLELRAGQASVQVRWVDAEGAAQATEIGMMSVMPVLLEEVIAYEWQPE